jgi:hypothetical protein
MRWRNCAVVADAEMLEIDGLEIDGLEDDLRSIDADVANVAGRVMSAWRRSS